MLAKWPGLHSITYNAAIVLIEQWAVVVSLSKVRHTYITIMTVKPPIVDLLIQIHIFSIHFEPPRRGQPLIYKGHNKWIGIVPNCLQCITVAYIQLECIVSCTGIRSMHRIRYQSRACRYHAYVAMHMHGNTWVWQHAKAEFYSCTETSIHLTCATSAKLTDDIVLGRSTDPVRSSHVATKLCPWLPVLYSWSNHTGWSDLQKYTNISCLFV